jgi:predicted ATP-grasp superfamily ATP-dependent carboligase
MGLHWAVFDPDAPTPQANPKAAGMVGKAILFARDPLVFPSEGPWLRSLRSPPALDELPDFADIPHAGERIEMGKPILTLFARADSEAGCMGNLRAIARHLDQWLFER